MQRTATRPGSRRWCAALAVALAATLVVAEAGPGVPSVAGAAPDAPSRSALADAVTFAGPDIRTILFSDWSAMKAAHGLSDVTSASPLDVRLDALLTLGELEAPFAGFALDRFAGWSEAWGWDTTDLDWEARLEGPGGPVVVLRLRPGFDLAPVSAWYDARGFRSELHGDAIIRSHPADPALDWQAASDPAVLTTALLAEGPTLILSEDGDAVRAVLDARDLPPLGGIRATPAAVAAEALGAPLAGAIEMGPDACRAYDPGAAGGDPGPNGALLAQVGPLGEWEAMGVGIDRDRDGLPGSSGRFAFVHAAVGDALRDQGARALLADQGFSLRSGEPHAGTTFRLATFGIDGPVVVLDVVPLDGLPQRIRGSFIARDLVFATCDRPAP